MDNEGYPEEYELKLIEQWDWRDVFGLIDYIGDRWAYGGHGFRKSWGKSKYSKRSVLFLELHTGGWSGNEEIINALLANYMAVAVLGYKQWNTGGHYKFEVDPFKVGFKPVSEIAAEQKVSRQYIHKVKEKYEWLTVGKRNQFIRLPHSSIQPSCQSS